MSILKCNTRVNQPVIRWDAHGCPPFKIGSDLSFLSRYKNKGVNFISMNVGLNLRTQTETLMFIEYFHQWIKDHSNEYALLHSQSNFLKLEIY